MIKVEDLLVGQLKVIVGFGRNEVSGGQRKKFEKGSYVILF